MYEGHRVKVKVTAATKREIPYSRNVKLRSAMTPVLWDFQPGQIEWSDHQLCHVIGNTATTGGLPEIRRHNRVLSVTTMRQPPSSFDAMI